LTLTLTSASAEETRRLGEILGKRAAAGDVYCLSGDLGAGKTVLAKGVAVGLGVRGMVTSPTFTLINEYEGRIPFYHMDFYRLEGPEELADLGYEEYFYGQGVTLIEWAENATDVLPEERLDIKIIHCGDDTRKITVKPAGDRYLVLVGEVERHVRAGD